MSSINKILSLAVQFLHTLSPGQDFFFHHLRKPEKSTFLLHLEILNKKTSKSWVDILISYPDGSSTPKQGSNSSTRMLIEIISAKSYSKCSEFEVKRSVFGTLLISSNNLPISFHQYVLLPFSAFFSSNELIVWRLPRIEVNIYR